jgi:hypothetical protein
LVTSGVDAVERFVVAVGELDVDASVPARACWGEVMWSGTLSIFPLLATWKTAVPLGFLGEVAKFGS